MATPRKIRGEYRPIYEALFHGKDYRRLTADGKLVLLTLKGLCGAIGMKMWDALAESLAEKTGIPTPRTKAAIRELIATEWIEYEDGIVWVVRGLEFEPQVSHGVKHQAWVHNELAGLPRSPIVDRFKQRYAVFFPETQSDRVSERVPGRPCDTTPQPQPPTPTLTPSPAPATASSPGAVSADDPAHRVLLAVAANKGVTAQWGEQPHPMRAESPHTQQAAEALQAERVDLDFAVRCLYTLASSRRPTNGRPPSSLKYFVHAVVDAWRAEQAHRQAATSPTPVRLTVIGSSSTGSWDDVIAQLERGEGLVDVA